MLRVTKLLSYPIYFLLDFLVALASFGIFLGIAWAIGDSSTYKLITMLIASALAFLTGGFVLSLLIKPPSDFVNLLFGCFWGLISSAYIFGLDWKVLVAFPIIGMLSGLGGRLANSLSGAKNV